MTPIVSRPNLSYPAFVFEHLVPRVPVRVPGASSEIPAVKKWTLGFLRETCGARPIRAYVSGKPETWTLRQFIERLEAGDFDEMAHPTYLRNASLVEFLPELIPDVVLPEYCTPNWLCSEVLARFIPPVWTNWIELFICGPGTRFPRVHVDSSMTHAWVIGVSGRKKFWAWPPMENQPNYSIHSEEQQKQRGLDCIGKDLDEFFEHAKPMTVELGAGDFLFLPTGWWHTAESITASIFLSGNFVNETNWDEFVECWFRGLKYLPGLESIGESLLRRGLLNQ